MARPKKYEGSTEQIIFRCPVVVKRGLEDLACLSRKGVSELLVELSKSFVDANKEIITNFRQQAEQSIKMPSFTASQKKKDAAQMSDEGDDSNDEG